MARKFTLRLQIVQTLFGLFGLAQLSCRPLLRVLHRYIAVSARFASAIHRLATVVQTGFRPRWCHGTCLGFRRGSSSPQVCGPHVHRISTPGCIQCSLRSIHICLRRLWIRDYPVTSKAPITVCAERRVPFERVATIGVEALHEDHADRSYASSRWNSGAVVAPQPLDLLRRQLPLQVS